MSQATFEVTVGSACEKIIAEVRAGSIDITTTDDSYDGCGVIPRTLWQLKSANDIRKVAAMLNAAAEQAELHEVAASR